MIPNLIPKKLLLIPLFAAAVFLTLSMEKPQEEDQILVFTKTAGYKHQSIPAGKTALLEAAEDYGFEVDTTSDAGIFNPRDLKPYKAVVFLNTTGDVLNRQQQTAFEEYIKSGGGFAGIHAAADTEYDWPWYGKLVGGYFKSHPKVQPADVHVLDHNHVSTQHLPEKWNRNDEWYNYKDLNPDTNVLATLDEKSYEGGENGDYHPIAWYHNYDGGRAFYTGGGHTDESYQEPEFLEHMIKGILWAGGMEVD